MPIQIVYVREQDKGMASFLERLQARRTAGQGLQAEDIIVRSDSGSKRTTVRAPTTILFSDREPSKDGLLAELTGHRVLQDSSPLAGPLSEDAPPWWMGDAPKASPQLDRLIPAARLVLSELFEDDQSHGDMAIAVKRAVQIAAYRLSSELRLSSRDILEATQELSGLILGKGPLQPLYNDPFVTDIYVDSYECVRCLRKGKALETPFRFRSKNEFEAFASSMLHSADKVLSVSSPIVDCVLKDQWRSRVNAVHGSIHDDTSSTLVIRIPRLQNPSLYDILKYQTLPTGAAAWLSELVGFGEFNILVMGPTGSGKTTLATALLSSVSSDERVCTIEDVPEIFVSSCQLEKLVVRPADQGGRGGIGARELLRAALHRAPHRIVVGEIKNEEASLFLEALETGHAGSIATMHADNPHDGLWRLLDLIATYERAPLEVIQRRICRSLHLVLVLKRIDGIPCVAEISELLPLEGHKFRLQPLIEFQGTVRGRRVWKRKVWRSRVIDILAEQGVELVPSPTLFPPDEPDIDGVAE